MYLLAVAYVTLKPRYGVSGAITPNFVPFRSVLDLLDGPASPLLMVKNLAGNVVLFLPFAVFLRTIAGGRPAKCLLAVLAVSVLIETVQGLGLSDGRGTNVDDVLLNVAGAAAGLTYSGQRAYSGRNGL